MPGFIDDLVPPNIGAPLVRLALKQQDASLRAFVPIQLTVTLLGDATTSGMSLPLEMTIMGPSKKLFKRVQFRRVVPSILTFTPREGGLHLIRLAETAHNNWYGTISLQIAGEKST